MEMGELGCENNKFTSFAAIRLFNGFAYVSYAHIRRRSSAEFVAAQKKRRKFLSKKLLTFALSRMYMCTKMNFNVCWNDVVPYVI